MRSAEEVWDWLKREAETLPPPQRELAERSLALDMRHGVIELENLSKRRQLPANWAEVIQWHYSLFF